MSGYASYEDALDPEYGEPFPVPMVTATAETLKGYGRIVTDFENEKVEITPWPVKGHRKLCPGTGTMAGECSGDFSYKWVDDQCTAINNAVGGDYVTGRLPADISPSNRTHVLKMSLVPELADVKAVPYEVPIVMATEESLRGYASIVRDFQNVKVEKTPWPLRGWRKARDDSDIIQGEESGDIYYKWENNKYIADKVIGRKNEIGVIIDNNNSLDGNTRKLPRTHVLAWESTYHPDCGEVFFPKNGDGFVVVLALPGDDIKPEDFVAFFCDGTFGIQTHPFVWHIGIFSAKDNVTFLGKQGLLHACVSVDFVKEFGRLISVPLTKPEE